MWHKPLQLKKILKFKFKIKDSIMIEKAPFEFCRLTT